MTPEYQIKIYYKTGDSFGSCDAEDIIEHEWKNIKSAQQSIIHIKNHYEYFLEKNSEWEKPKGKLPDGIG